MNDEQYAPGSLGWHDITVENADTLRDFYVEVMGWTFEPLDMGGYNDYVMKDSAGKPVGGICHARGPNTGLPPQWLMYVCVESFDRAAAACKQNGGEIISDVRTYEGRRYAVLRDPAGAVCAIIGP